MMGVSFVQRMFVPTRFLTLRTKMPRGDLQFHCNQLFDGQVEFEHCYNLIYTGGIVA